MLPISTLKSFEDADKALLQFGKNEAFIAKKEAAMNQRIQKIKDEFDIQTAQQRAANEMIEKNIEAFCLQNKAEFQKQRTKKLIHGSIGFRTKPPKVLQLNRKYNVKTSIELIKKIFSGAYIRIKEEIDKERILTDLAQEKLNDEKLASVGLKVDQDEKFVIEIDWETLGEKAA